MTTRVNTYENGKVVHIGSTGDAVGSAVAKLVAELSHDAIAKSGRFTVALSGGSLPKVHGRRIIGSTFHHPPIRFSKRACHVLLNESALWVASISDSPKPPPKRITLTYPVVNNAAAVAFVATGESKAPLMRHVLGVEVQMPPLPAARVLPTAGQVHWFIDEAAAAKL
ncbi:hypothetical protein DYB35_002390 [Aphanomyces astaci]|uniref:Glucosamine/galactosamine-6-phosphate isomerase domain-containing protein n=1 Tax=Aphanomyces astaci TaxID=112090 RepID=A0A418DH02_APHAT|nr:hypothetical protein DYB35_002390 [Aphanomyces astaci]